MSARCIAAAVLVLGGCEPAPSDGWTRQPLAGGAYTLAVPPGMACSDGRGVDSAVARCTGDGLDLALDWGRYGGVPLGTPAEAERVGGRDVTVARDAGMAVYHFEAEPIDLGDGTFTDATTLTVHARCSGQDTCETARRIVRTVRF